MPLVHVKFFPEPREYTDEQIAELRESGLLREDKPASPPPGAPVAAATPAPAAAAAISKESK